MSVTTNIYMVMIVINIILLIINTIMMTRLQFDWSKKTLSILLLISIPVINILMVLVFIVFIQYKLKSHHN